MSTDGGMNWSACTTGEDCGLYCNGEETCDAGSCQSGTPVDCDDGVACTADSCDEDADACVNTADDGLCDNGDYCDGAETCDGSTTARSGRPWPATTASHGDEDLPSVRE